MKHFVHILFCWIVLSGTSQACSLKKYEYCKFGIGRKMQLEKAGSLSKEPISWPAFRKKKNKARSVESPTANNDLTSTENNAFSTSPYPIDSSFDFLLHTISGGIVRGPPAGMSIC